MHLNDQEWIIGLVFRQKCITEFCNPERLCQPCLSKKAIKEEWPAEVQAFHDGVAEFQRGE